MAPDRHLLVVASHCKAEGPLTGLHATAHALADILRDDRRGRCAVDAANGNAGLLLDADRKMTEQAVKRAARSARDKVLVLVWIGHGRTLDSRFFLMPCGAQSETIEDTGIELIPLLEAIQQHQPSGLLLAIDACEAGAALVSALTSWVNSQGPAIPLTILTATGAAPAFNLSFSRGLSELLCNGIGDAGEELNCAILRDRLCEIVGEQTAHLMHYHGTHERVPLWMGHNVAFDRNIYSKLTALREQNLMLSEVIKSVADRLINETSNLALVADAGAGKTTLSAMLVQMPRDLRAITRRQHLVDASFFATQETTFFRVVQAFSNQLALHRGFREAARRFESRTDLEDEERMLLEPLRIWAPILAASDPTAKITFLFDSLDSIGVALPRVLALLGDIGGIPGARVLMTGRAHTVSPDNFERHELDCLHNAEVTSYLTRTGVHPAVHEALLKRIAGNWLCAAVFAEEATAREISDPAEVADLTLEKAFDDRLERLEIGVEPLGDPAGPLTMVFATLAAAGAGAAMPIDLLRAACAAQGGPATDEEFDRALKKLGGLTAHGASERTSLWGLFHQALVDHARRSAKYRARVKAAHAAIVETLEIRVPNRTEASSVEWRYAFDRELDHRLEVGRLKGELARFMSIKAADPRDNRSLWARLTQGLAEILPSDHPDLFAARNNRAYFTGAYGDNRSARDLYAALLRDVERTFHADDEIVLRTRANLAFSTGECGDACGARDLFAALLTAQIRAHGPRHEDVLRTRANLATWTGECGDARGALDLLTALLPDRRRELGPNHPDVFLTRYSLAEWTGKSGDVHRARVLFAALQRDQTRVLGPDHEAVLTTRAMLAQWTGACGDADGARDIYAALLPDQQRILGPDHRNVFHTRIALADWTARCGDAGGARDLFAALLPDQQRVFGPDHPDTLKTREIFAHWEEKSGRRR